MSNIQRRTTGEPEQPLVSVVTPVYNGEQYLSECIESILVQDYDNWEYLIVNNRSTDKTLDIAQNYAQKDPRIKVLTNDGYLPLIQNWNHALRQISPESKYCKVAHADDLLFEGCIRHMVEVAEQNPAVGIVGAYRIVEDRVNLDSLRYPSPVISGREICRQQLLGSPDMFGSPTSILIRADLVREREKFYNEQELHADTEVCFELLQNADFGFVHQVLTYTRRHNEAVTATHKILNTILASQFIRVMKYGPSFLSETEYRSVYKSARKMYYRVIGLKMIKAFINKDIGATPNYYWTYHKNAMAAVGRKLSPLRLIGAVMVIMYNKAVVSLMVK